MVEAQVKESQEVLGQDELVQAEVTPRWVRVEFNRQILADSKRALLVREEGRTPVYYFPREDVNFDHLDQSEKVIHDPRKGKTIHWDVVVGKRTALNAAFAHPEPRLDMPELKDYISFGWEDMDAWYEEEEQIFVHPKDPYKRVDILPSSRHIRIELEGTLLAESRRPWLLFETGLPTRYYLPPEDVRAELLKSSDTHSSCPYKGNASYFSIELDGEEYKDLIWNYREPTDESARIKGLLAFYNEKVDIYVDGVLQDRPETYWS